jgi:hypothetical protein
LAARIGFASATANVLIEQASGDDVLGHTLALFSDDPVDLTRPEQIDLLAQASAQTPSETVETAARQAEAAPPDDRDRGYRLARAAGTTISRAIG